MDSAGVGVQTPIRLDDLADVAIAAPTDGYVLSYDSASALWSPSAAGVSGPATSTDNAIATFDGATGEILQSTDVTLSSGAFARASGDMSFTLISGNVLFNPVFGENQFGNTLNLLSNDIIGCADITMSGDLTMSDGAKCRVTGREVFEIDDQGFGANDYLILRNSSDGAVLAAGGGTTADLVLEPGTSGNIRAEGSIDMNGSAIDDVSGDLVLKSEGAEALRLVDIASADYAVQIEPGVSGTTAAKIGVNSGAAASDWINIAPGGDDGGVNIANKLLGVGLTQAMMSAESSASPRILVIGDNDDSAVVLLSSYSDVDVRRGLMVFDRYEGDYSSPTAVGSDVRIHETLYRAYDGSSLVNSMRLRVESTGAFSGGGGAAKMLLVGDTSGGTSNTMIRIDNSGKVKFGKDTAPAEVVDIDGNLEVSGNYTNVLTCDENIDLSSSNRPYVVFDFAGMSSSGLPDGTLFVDSATGKLSYIDASSTVHALY